MIVLYDHCFFWEPVVSVDQDVCILGMVPSLVQSLGESNCFLNLLTQDNYALEEQLMVDHIENSVGNIHEGIITLIFIASITIVVIIIIMMMMLHHSWFGRRFNDHLFKVQIC